MRILMAKLFCKLSHGTQKRKYTGEPYWTHPFEAYRLVSNCHDDQDVAIAALFHDIIEDTYVPLWAIKLLFGKRVAGLVREVSDISKPWHGNRKTRKAIDRLFIQNISDDAKTIKLADFISNTKSIWKYDPNFSKVYMVEKRELLPLLVGGKNDLFSRAKSQVEEYFNEHTAANILAARHIGKIESHDVDISSIIDHVSRVRKNGVTKYLASDPPIMFNDINEIVCREFPDADHSERKKISEVAKFFAMKLWREHRNNG